MDIFWPNMSSNTSPMRKCAAIARQEIAAAVIVTYLKFQDGYDSSPIIEFDSEMRCATWSSKMIKI